MKGKAKRKQMNHTVGNFGKADRAVQKSMEKELTQALQTFGYQLTALSEKFVNDYAPLTDKLRELLKMAEQKSATQSQTVK